MDDKADAALRRAESMGYGCGEVGDPVGSNPYLDLVELDGLMGTHARLLADAWLLGWSRAVGAPRPSATRGSSERVWADLGGDLVQARGSKW